MPATIDYDNARLITRALTTVFTLNVSTVIADFTPNTFCDSSGLSVLAQCHRQAAASGITLRVAVPHASLFTYLTRVGLADLLVIHPSLDQALHAAVNRGQPWPHDADWLTEPAGVDGMVIKTLRTVPST